MRELRTVLSDNLKMFRKGYALDKKFFAVKCVVTVYGCMLTIISIILPKYLLMAIQDNSIQLAVIVLGSSFLLSILGSAIEKIYTPYSAVATEKMNVKITEAFLEKSFSLELSYFENADAYNKYAMVFDNCTNVVHSSMEVFFGGISAILNIVLALSLLFWMNKLLMILMICFIMLQLFIDKKRKKIIFDYQKSTANANRELNYLYRLFYVPQFMRDIRVNSLKQFIFQKKEEATDLLLERVGKTNQKISGISFVLSVMTHIETMLTSMYFVYESIRGRIELGDFFVALNAYGSVKGALSAILSSYNALYENDLYIGLYLDFMNESGTEDDDNLEELEEIDSIEFRDVTFTYPNANEKSLDKVSFSIQKGARVAIVGYNGAGKTTIVKLLLRLYVPDDGEILINGKNICLYKASSLRRKIAVLFQDFSIYPFSVKENIAIGKNVSNDIILNALRMVGMMDKVLKLKHGLETPITSQMEDDGIELSGGESQRLAIARVMASDCKTLILDEPTSSLDPYIENELYSSILAEKDDRIILMVSHRMVFTNKADLVICMNQGSMEEVGTPKELMAKVNGTYKRLVELNCKKYDL